MMLLKKFRLMKACFPRTWPRKTPLLFFPADTITIGSDLAAVCITWHRRIILLCVSEKHRRKGFATKLIQRSNALKTDTYADNPDALRLWLKNGFEVEKTIDSLLGRKHILVRRENAKKCQ